LKVKLLFKILKKLLMQGFMNNVLDHKDIVFFNPYPDEKEQFSVNHDAWGTGITYAGYFIVFSDDGYYVY
jgi:signal peptidase I